MKNIPLIGAGLLVLGLAAFSGCSNPRSDKPKDGAKPAKGGAESDHAHGMGPHGGTIFDFGKWHAEFTVDHKAREATIHLLGTDEKTQAPIAAEQLLLSIKDPQFQVNLRAVPQEGNPAGTSSRFVGKHEKFGKEQEFEGTLSGVVGGKPYAGDFQEEAELPKK